MHVIFETPTDKELVRCNPNWLNRWAEQDLQGQCQYVWESELKSVILMRLRTTSYWCHSFESVFIKHGMSDQQETDLNVIYYFNCQGHHPSYPALRVCFQVCRCCWPSCSQSCLLSVSFSVLALLASPPHGSMGWVCGSETEHLPVVSLMLACNYFCICLIPCWLVSTILASAVNLRIYIISFTFLASIWYWMGG